MLYPTLILNITAVFRRIKPRDIFAYTNVYCRRIYIGCMRKLNISLRVVTQAELEGNLIKDREKLCTMSLNETNYLRR